ncbi:MAG: hypothetical protein KBC65_08870 [Polaromonas sp.]|nr:hypothetical protein [Polaromonas sp.]
MAGTKGHSGGSRPNTGGARPGAGRPKSPPVLIDIEPTNDPLQFLQVVMNDDAIDLKLRAAAASTLMPYIHAKKNEGKKDEKQSAAKKASAGKYASVLPPMRLVT